MNQTIDCDRDLTAMDAAQRTRYEEALRHVEGAAIDAEPIDGGFAIRYPADAGSIASLAEFIALERLCCPFFDFELALAAGAEVIELRLTGGPGVQEFLEAEIRSRGSAPL